MCVKLTKQSKRLCYNNLDTKRIADNKNFWKNTKPFFSEKQRKLSKIILLENNRILSCDEDVANTFNTYFLQDNTCTLTNVETTPENKQENIKNICKHPSIIKINESVAIEGTFSLHSVTSKKWMKR